MITCHKKYLKARCRERGYRLEDVMPCVVEQDGDRWSIDETHQAYPKAKSRGLELPATISDWELAKRQKICATCEHLRKTKNNQLYCSLHCGNCVRRALGKYQNALLKQEPWCEFWKNTEEIETKQNQKELDCVLKDVESVKPKVFVEIGVHAGGSLLRYAEACAPGATIIGVDNFSRIETQKHVPNVLSTLKEQGYDAHCVKGNSQSRETADKVSKLLGGRLVDCLHIDGSHKAADVKKDWEIWSRMVRQGGLVIFHDIANRPKGVTSVWRKCRKNKRYKEYIAEKNTKMGTGVLWYFDKIIAGLVSIHHRQHDLDCLKNLLSRVNYIVIWVDKNYHYRESEIRKLLQDEGFNDTNSQIILSDISWKPRSGEIWREPSLRCLDAIKPEIVLQPDSDEKFDENYYKDLANFIESDADILMYTYKMVYGGKILPSQRHCKIFKWYPNLYFKPYRSNGRPGSKNKKLKEAKATHPILHYKKLKISAILPAREEGDQVKQTCISFLNAGVDELIVIDDASKDESCHNLPATVITNKQALGVGVVRNQGAKIATGKVLIFADAHERATDLTAFAQAAIDNDAIICAAVKPLRETGTNGPGGKSSWTGYGAKLIVDKAAYKDGWIMVKPKKRLTPITALIGACYAMRREIFDRIGGWIETRQWGYNEQAFTMKAWFCNIPLLIDRDTIIYHQFKKKFKYPLSLTGSHLNRYHVHSVIFDEDTMEKIWLPRFLKAYGKKVHRKGLQLIEEVREEAEAFKKIKQRTDSEFLSTIGRLT